LFILLLIVLAVVLGGFGLLVKGLLWLFVIGAIVFVVGAVLGLKALRH
jgi:hypothetical protein